MSGGAMVRGVGLKDNLILWEYPQKPPAPRPPTYCPSSLLKKALTLHGSILWAIIVYLMRFALCAHNTRHIL
jgi:hypothetical protein